MSDEISRYDGSCNTVIKLKLELRKRKLAVSGRKQVLVKRLKDYDRMCEAVPIVQRAVRLWLVKLYLRSKGPALWARNKCKNQKDFYTQAPVQEIQHSQLFSYADAKGNVYAFDLLSFMNLRFGAGQIIRNPYTNEPIKRSLEANARSAVRLGRCLRYKVNTCIVHEDLSDEQKAVDFFQEMASLSFTSDHQWLTGLSHERLKRFYYNLHLQWRRAPLDLCARKRICPPNGLLFEGSEQDIRELDRAATLMVVLRLGRRLTSHARDIEDRRIGATVFLSVLVMHSPAASNSLPWLNGAARLTSSETST